MPTTLMRRAARTATVVAAVAALGSGAALVADPALAAKPGGSTGTTASCSVAPDPVAVGATYTLSASGLGAGAIVDVFISDSGGTSAWNLQADANGQVSLKTWSYWTGTSKVTVQKSVKRGWSTVATCSFSVV